MCLYIHLSVCMHVLTMLTFKFFSEIKTIRSNSLHYLLQLFKLNISF